SHFARTRLPVRTTAQKAACRTFGLRHATTPPPRAQLHSANPGLAFLSGRRISRHPTRPGSGPTHSSHVLRRHPTLLQTRLRPSHSLSVRRSSMPWPLQEPRRQRCPLASAFSFTLGLPGAETSLQGSSRIRRDVSTGKAKSNQHPFSYSLLFARRCKRRPCPV